jgi:hypothetical protein
MNVRKILILIILCPALCSIAAAAYGQQTSGGSAGAFFGKFGASGISGDQQYLYVMAAGKILEYQLTDMTLLLSVDLPDLGGPPQAATLSTSADSGQPPPPPPPMPQGLWAGDGYLYVLRGPSVYTYSVPALTLQNTTALPKPGLPQTGK